MKGKIESNNEKSKDNRCFAPSRDLILAVQANFSHYKPACQSNGISHKGCIAV